MLQSLMTQKLTLTKINTTEINRNFRNLSSFHEALISHIKVFIWLAKCILVSLNTVYVWCLHRLEKNFHVSLAVSKQTDWEKVRYLKSSKSLLYIIIYIIN